VIQALAYCIVRRNHEVLLRRGEACGGDKSYFYPLGGIMQAGEYSWDAVRRHAKMALDSELHNLTFMGPSEFIGREGDHLLHQIIFLFEADLAEADCYHQPQIGGKGPDRRPCLYRWQPLLAFQRKRNWLLPESLADMMLE